jgi:hypothetical protein
MRSICCTITCPHLVKAAWNAVPQLKWGADGVPPVVNTLQQHMTCGGHQFSHPDTEPLLWLAIQPSVRMLMLAH